MTFCSISTIEGQRFYVLILNPTAAGGTVILVGQDGVQRSPIVFPRGGHLLAFLTCLETGLLPNGQLDPPLWSEKGKGYYLLLFNRECIFMVLPILLCSMQYVRIFYI